MIELYVWREPKPGQPTMGKLYFRHRGGDWTYFCETLEDQYRGQDMRAKVPGETCIPHGTYPLSLTHSPRFGVIMPLISAVERFTGIRIHPLNIADETEGCLGVGTSRGVINGKPAILDSRTAYSRLLPILKAELPVGVEEGRIGNITYSPDAPKKAA